MHRIVAVVLALLFAPVGPAGAEADAASQGRILFEQKCASCHTIGGGPRVGPDLHGAHQRRTEEWLIRFITQPDRMIAEKDEIAVRLVEQFNRIVMPNLGLKASEARALLGHIRSTSDAAAAPAEAPAAAAAALGRPQLIAPQSIVLGMFFFISAIILLVFAWVGFSTRSPEEVNVKKAYGFRKTLFASASVVVVAALALTMPGAPYAVASIKPDRIVYVAARQFDFVFSDEPITSAADLGRIPTLQRLELPADALVEFRVTSLDVNHGFGVYGPERQLLAQTQAMPGYVNRLRVRLAQGGFYKVFCLEYCAAGHHAMQSGFNVK
jgi:heme/copper-type cytochrome/quinol oxidase subunit 2